MSRSTTTGQSNAAGMILRALQLLLAIVVMGTDGYAINSYHSYSVDTQFSWGGSAVLTYGVPASWGFLMFCAGWTFIAAILFFSFKNKLADRSLLSWTVVAVELIAVLSWLAGFVAVAVEIGTDTCPAGRRYCGSLIGATVAGGLEFLLFVITFAATSVAVMDGAHRTPFSHTTRSMTNSYRSGSHSSNAKEAKQSKRGHAVGV